MVALDGGFLDCSVYAFDLTIAPGIVDLCDAMFDPMLKAAKSNMWMMYPVVGPLR